ncbi:HNH endonuclease signature motif containing protein [Roseicyclus sp. F158]|uniref:HNH endonuclease signature motif containing protein n=1 Tax=Tropicimonas omnivorans TaxID=3075590 RepID=A0ABU3DIA3_9RHOB|nr:HNH endonuclease signature motif containing protein [Roseicyclus sp. F158]MDT0683417.1 HNH endonuclease signature motif containing protein [Roseicyclus sp. F158]
MWPLQSPGHTAAQAFDAARSRLRNIDNIRDRLGAARTDILETADDYREKGVQQLLYEIGAHDEAPGEITKPEMIRLYESGLRRVNAGRHIYDAIMALAPNGLCPYCGHRRVRQLDHFLPKSKYPTFSVTPQNLVPSCSDCNTDKLSGDADKIEDLPLHPYFENVDDVAWLKADILEGPSAVFLYSVDEESGIDAISLIRLKYQIENLGLDALYSIEANDLLSSIRLTLRRLYAAGGADTVRRHLEGEYDSSLFDRRNSWRTAFFKASCENEWFLDGGFEDDELD